MRMCAKDKIPIVPSGACTSLEGHLAALQGGICINMRDMNAVLEVNAEDMDVHAQAGVTRSMRTAVVPAALRARPRLPQFREAGSGD